MGEEEGETLGNKNSPEKREGSEQLCGEEAEKRPRRVVQGYHQFNGQLIQMPELEDLGAVGQFDGGPTEFNMEIGIGRHDSRLQHIHYDHAVVGSQFLQLSKVFGVTLATQSSVDRLHLLIKSLETWSGPVSISVFVPGPEFDVAQTFISYLRSCNQEVRERVAFSLSHPLNLPPQAAGIVTTGWTFPCSDPSSVLTRLTSGVFNKAYLKWRTGYSYPQNVLRNLARQTSITHYTLSLDVDIVPSPGLAPPLASFLAGNTCSKCAFVLPTYEIHEAASLPQDKSQLALLVKRHQARPFHSKVLVHNQFATNFSRLALDQDDSVVHVSHNVTAFEFFYEPFYVSLDSAPLYDERFEGYGFTRNTQAYELHLAGWQFQVLSPVFTVHWGLAKKKGRPTWRERQNSNNRKRFPHFKKELYARYNLDYAAEWAREQAAIKAEHDKMMKRFKPAKPTKKPGG